MKKYSERILAKRRGWLALLLAVALLLSVTPAAQAAGGKQVRVLLSSAVASGCTVTVKQGSFNLSPEDDSGHILATCASGSIKLSYSGGLYQARVNNATYESSTPLQLNAVGDNALFSFGAKVYRGSFQFCFSNGTCYGINILDLEQYLYGVVGCEMGYNYSAEALKAQAVASRSYALSGISAANKRYDLTNGDSDQVYGGYGAEAEAIRAAVDATRGMVVTWQGAAVRTNYCANAGGHTEDRTNIWGSSSVPMPGVASAWDAKAVDKGGYAASTYSWQVKLSADELESIAQRYGGLSIGEFQRLELYTTYGDKTSVSGRALAVKIVGSNSSFTLVGNDSICSALGLQSSLITVNDNQVYVLGADGSLQPYSDKSQLYAIGRSLIASLIGGSDGESFSIISANGTRTVSKKAAAVDSSGQVTIIGKGSGHGVGMSQWGAIAMAEEGYTWQEIVEYYYCSGGCKVTQYYQ